MTSSQDMAEARRAAFVAWMEREGVSQSAVSRATGIPKTTLSSSVSGRSNSLLGTNQDKIASAFGTTLETIFGSWGEANDSSPSGLDR